MVPSRAQQELMVDLGLGSGFLGTVSPGSWVLVSVSSLIFHCLKYLAFLTTTYSSASLSLFRHYFMAEFLISHSLFKLTVPSLQGVR